MCVLADQDSYDAGRHSVREGIQDDRCVLGAIRVANPTTALVEVDQALKQARSQAATTFSRHNAGVQKSPATACRAPPQGRFTAAPVLHRRARQGQGDAGGTAR